eukprot:7184979-Karenia_brevis.AAC.1
MMMMMMMMMLLMVMMMNDGEDKGTYLLKSISLRGTGKSVVCPAAGSTGAWCDALLGGPC